MTAPIPRRVEPLVWLMFSGGGVLAAVLLPGLVLPFALLIPLGIVDPPDHAHLQAVVAHPLTRLVLLGAFVLMLVHAAHRFRYTLYDGLQIKARRTVAVLCYGTATVAALTAVGVLWAVG